MFPWRLLLGTAAPCWQGGPGLRPEELCLEQGSHHSFARQSGVNEKRSNAVARQRFACVRGPRDPGPRELLDEAFHLPVSRSSSHACRTSLVCTGCHGGCPSSCPGSPTIRDGKMLFSVSDSQKHVDAHFLPRPPPLAVAAVR